MPIFKNAQGDVLDVPESLAGFVRDRGYFPAEVPVEAAVPVVGATPEIPAATTPDPPEGDNDSEGVTTND